MLLHVFVVCVVGACVLRMFCVCTACVLSVYCVCTAYVLRVELRVELREAA